MSNLIEGPYEILIGEPWDYVNPRGEGNRITGNILKVIQDEYILFRSDYFLQEADIKSDILVLSARHYEKYNKLYDFIINGGLFFGKEIVDDIKYLQTNSKFILIGSIHSNPKSN
jgi:hypothetical protein